MFPDEEGYLAPMTSAIVDVEPRVTAAQVRRARVAVLKAARRHGLSAVQLADDGTVVVHVEQDPTYRSVLRFVAEAFAAVGAEVHVITDDTQAASRLVTRPL